MPPTQDPQSSTSCASESVPLRHPNTYPKVLNLGRGKGKGKFPLSNWTSLEKGCGCRISNGSDIPQTPPIQQEPEKNLAVVAPMDRIQTYEGDLAKARTRKPLANWTYVSLDNTWGRLNNKNIENRPGWRLNNHDNRTSDDTESEEGDAIYSDEDGSTSSRPGLEDLQ